MHTKKTKIVCTIGPSTWDPQVMKALIENGMNCARVNGAFANPEELDKVAGLVRAVSDEVSLMVDVKGPEVRMNKFEAPLQIKPGDEIKIGNDDSSAIYPANYKDLYKSIKPGQRILIGDGDVELKVKEVSGDTLICEVIYGSLLKPGKALNLPGCDYATSVLTEKDKENLEHAIKTGWDFVSASFIQSAEAAKEVRAFIGDRPMQLIAKIEDAQGVDNIDEILEHVDGIMIARGGLGVEMGLEKVAIAQRILLGKAVAAGKPVITATQMLESMIENPRPTRAEAGDVSTAILLGTDSVMLSGESSAGKYPVEAVKFLTSAALVTEEAMSPAVIDNNAMCTPVTDALTKAAASICIDLEDEIDAVFVYTRTGITARLIGRNNIKQPIFAFTPNDFVKRTVMLSKGITKAITFQTDEKLVHRDHAIDMIVEQARKHKFTDGCKKVLVIGKVPNAQSAFLPNIFDVINLDEY